MKHTSFRGWVHNLWLENCEERVLYQGGARLNEREYFNQFKWWLRREWRHRQQLERARQTKAQIALEKLQQAMHPDQ